MKAFEFDRHLINSYERFSRSFSEIHSEDLRSAIDEQYNQGRFWPDALLSLNPRFLSGRTVDELVASGELDEATGKIFRLGEEPLRLHRHQEQAIVKAKSEKSFVVTTGTGSGKSLCFFVPVADAVIRARREGKPKTTRAIIIYPMNALANSQINEIDKFIGKSGLPDDLKPVVKRYTGQESREERRGIAGNPPDILLTNYMMAELLLTRQDELDSRVIGNAVGLEFIILDEFHAYRGRQGADVAVLVRRLRDRCARDKTPICIGTSATMASKEEEEEGEGSGTAAVAEAASKLFGTGIGPDAVIDESLRRATDAGIGIEQAKAGLADALGKPVQEPMDDESLSRHPLAVWSELALGLDDRRELKRRKPMPFGDAVALLARDSGVDEERCRNRLEAFLTTASLPESQRGGEGEEAFLAFKLHRFISGAGEIFTTLAEGNRKVLFEGQLEDPDAPGNRLYPTRFCRNCGQEYHVVTRSEADGRVIFLPRNVDDVPLEAEQGDDAAGYLCPVPENDPDFAFDGELSGYPENWLEGPGGSERLRSSRRKRKPAEYGAVALDGKSGEGKRRFWFIPGKFAFCLRCKDEPGPNMRERSKLAGLSGEGRSSATTLLVSSALEWMNAEGSGIPETKRKILGFTDNRQDAALQSGHFNDFLFVSLLRGAILRAVIDEGKEGLAEDEFGLKVAKALGFTAGNKEMLVHWMLDPSAGAVIREDAQRTLAKALAHRVWADLRRGWRYANPSLSALNLLDVEFVGLSDMASDRERMMEILPELGEWTREQRADLLKCVLGAMLEGLAVNAEALDLTVLDGIAQRSRSLLRSPWAIHDEGNPRSRASLVLRAPGKKEVRLREERTLLRAGPNSRIARMVNKAINERNPFGGKLGRDDYLDFLPRLLDWFAQEGLAAPVELNESLTGWRLSPAAVRLVPGLALEDRSRGGNSYFHDLYVSIADGLASGECAYWGLEGREHTAQVSGKRREWREWRFRHEGDDLEKLKASEHRAEIRESGESDRFLPALFCSPTMELGIDISDLNAVYHRNVPPTPANYAQRAGRSGRSGQAAVVTTYCASGSPHDQYFFKRRNEMAAGVVRPPALDVTNEELVRSHLHAVWLAQAKLALSPDIPEILDLGQRNYPLREGIHSAIRKEGLASDARAPMQRILEQILGPGEEGKPSWMDSPEAFALEVAENAPKAFDEAFDRWRALYESARSQLEEAHKRSETTGLSGADRRAAKAAWMQASDQIAILEQGKASNGSDFYSYRYLATEGFLPGYNFPRLPLYAFVPGKGKTGSFLSRARFLAISEFGPRSLIYHEGRAYRVMKAKLPPEARKGDGSELATRDVCVCADCGACHEEEAERCHGCGARMADATRIKNALRIDNVETAPVERITANDEERVRQGFDIQTVFAWPGKDGRIQVSSAEFKCGDNSLLSLQYANGAEISRLNKGLKRRKERAVFGFHIDPRTGYWAKSEDEGDEAEPSPEVAKPVRIVPIVRDRKNALLLRFRNPEAYGPDAIATVQHALLRGIEVAYQLEEGEILSEPLPDRDNRRAILAYEATEGGAGVLARLMDEPEAIGRVARTALELMHFERVEEAIRAGDAGLLSEKEGEACARGCYRCLLSYFNQPDHERIHRESEQVSRLLVDLARGLTVPEERFEPGDSPSPWPRAFEEAGLPRLDAASVDFDGAKLEFAWRRHLVAATAQPVSSGMAGEAADKGWELVELPASPEAGVPERLVGLLKG